MRTLTTAAAMLLTALPAFGWGRDGHAVIAEIATRELSPETAAKIAELLEGNPAGGSIVETASWADAVRPTEPYRWSAPLHYVNMPIDATGYDHARDCPPNEEGFGCVVSAIDRFATQLGDESLPTEQRIEALMFLVHFVGDLHQPLHGGRQEDRGGNDIRITFLGTETNLHRAWDSQILEAVTGSQPWPLLAESLHSNIGDLHRVAYLADTASQNWIDTAGRWAFESHHLAEEYCYIIEDGQAVGMDYAMDVAPVVLVRLQQAGVRLAAVLEWAMQED
ncbi:MAG: S1/P1 nuclease [Planctomycetota bacterium]